MPAADCDPDSFHSEAALSPQEDISMGMLEWLEPGIYGAVIAAATLATGGFTRAGRATLSGVPASDRDLARACPAAPGVAASALRPDVTGENA
ncbi:hypothetical protein NHU_01162 [Rhodovulum sulfidophilum]|uniref:Uncharacterized protein n=1 Tax=Rhodovulum sulfidophilum TaxID=35806 RepID=A0A0D6B0U8_RHOSU|nr:hypothetical protein NHU_01162 [Rhodovulum sulfidophilum]